MAILIFPLKNIPFIVWIIGSIILFVVIIYLMVKSGKKHTAADDLIFLEMLIKNSTGSEVDKKTIYVILTDYLERAEYQCPELYRLNKEFQKKFFDIETLRDKLTIIEVKRFEEHSPESIFGT